MADQFLTTPLNQWHTSHGGRMVEFAGWLMPVQYTSIVDEHVATRTACGLFDVSHMGRLEIDGPGARQWLESMLTRRVVDMELGVVRYTLITNDHSEILDDALVSCESIPSSQSQRFGLVVNASNRARVVQWLLTRMPDAGVRLIDRTLESAMIAVQGPLAVHLVADHISAHFRETLMALKPYRFLRAELLDIPASFSRTGYTGEDGFEIIVPANRATEVWESLYSKAHQKGLRACGLGARDTLRLEAAMPLYGHELKEITNPFAAGLSLAVDLEGRTFPGSNRLAACRDHRDHVEGTVRVGLRFDSKRPAREGHEVFFENTRIGTVTSGSFAPSLGYAVAMANLSLETSKVGTTVEVLVRNNRETAHVVPLPFYRRKK